MKGTVINIQRFSIHDGPGIRTTVFLKGCPLHCSWCHNPESQKKEPEIAFSEGRCVRCGTCFNVCPNGVFVRNPDGGRIIRYEKCIGCGICEQECMASALELMGKEYTAEEIIKTVEEDRAFMGEAGGMTVSGGEPTVQAEFAEELLSLAKLKGIDTTLETCGYCAFDRLERLLPYLDRIYYDLKIMDDEMHRRHTGAGSVLIHDNLRKLAELKAPVTVRMPVIPGYTDSVANFSAAADFLNSLGNPFPVEVLGYNEMAGSKYPRLGLAFSLEGVRKADGNSPETLACILKQKGIRAIYRT